MDPYDRELTAEEIEDMIGVVRRLEADIERAKRTGNHGLHAHQTKIRHGSLYGRKDNAELVSRQMARDYFLGKRD